MVVEEGDGFRGGLDEAAGLGLEGEEDVAAIALRDGGAVGYAVGEIVEDRREIGGGLDPRFPGAWDGGDGAGGALRDEGGEDGGDLVCVFAALRGTPVGGVNVFLYGATVEAAVGEGVDGEDVEVFGIEESGEFGEGGGGVEGGGGGGAEAKTEAERATGGDEVTDGQKGGAEGGEVFGPGFTGVDVQAVGEGHGGGGVSNLVKFSRI